MVVTHKNDLLQMNHFRWIYSQKWSSTFFYLNWCKIWNKKHLRRLSLQDSGNNANGANTNRAKLVFKCVYSKKSFKTFFSLIMGGVHIFLIMGYRFRNELICAKAITCAKITSPIYTHSMIVCIIKWLFKETVAPICKTTQ